MWNFLNKETRLCLSAINYIFLLFVIMLIIPNYPAYITFFYIGLSVFWIFNNGTINRDIQYSLILPVKKSDIVKARCLLIAVYELAAFVLSVPFAVLAIKFRGIPNVAGIEPNVAFYGLCMIVMTGFNFVFVRAFYKKAEKPGLPFLLASITFIVLYLLVEFPIWAKNILNVEYFKLMDSTDSASLVRQLPVLAAGIVIFIAGWIVTYKSSAKRFEKVDL